MVVMHEARTTFGVVSSQPRMTAEVVLHNTRTFAPATLSMGSRASEPVGARTRWAISYSSAPATRHVAAGVTATRSPTRTTCETYLRTTADLTTSDPGSAHRESHVAAMLGERNRRSVTATRQTVDPPRSGARRLALGPARRRR